MTTKHINSAKRGFTLVELSIVLVIIGLIVGGVLTGQALIEAAKVRGQLTQLEQLDTAMNAFRAKFDCLPGDCTATSGITANLAATTNAGDGLINYSTTWAVDLEAAVVAAQLVDQNMISGTYTPNATYSAAQIPNAKLAGHIMIGSAESQNFYALGNYTTVAGVAGLPASGAFAIDNKRDDGVPTTGLVTAVETDAAGPFGAEVDTDFSGDATDCLSAAAAYNTAGSAAVCTVRARISG